MNKMRRKCIGEAIAKLEWAKEMLDQVREEEEEAYGNLPEGIQDSDRGNEMEDNVYTLENAVNDIEDVIGDLGEIN